jgi:magnesium-transporting ATPase (P-type)
MAGDKMRQKMKDKVKSISKRFSDYATNRTYGDVFSAALLFSGLVLLITDWFLVQYPNGQGLISGETKNNTKVIQEETDKSAGKHETWDWILFVSGLLALIQFIQVGFLDLMWMRKKELAAYMKSDYCVGKGDDKKPLHKNVYFWMYIFIGIHSLAGLWHIINVVHTAVRVAELDDGAAFTFYAMATTAAVLFLAGTLVIVGFYGYGLRRFAKACKNLKTPQGQTDPLIARLQMGHKKF